MDEIDKLQNDLNRIQHENDLRMFESLDKRWVIPVRTKREKEDA